MSGIFDDSKRQVIPRCLDYLSACSLGLLRIIRSRDRAIRGAIQSSRSTREWQINPNLATAVDLVAESLIINNYWSDEAIEAANYILVNAPSSSLLIRDIANHFLEQQPSNVIEPNSIMMTDVSHQSIARLKKSVRLYPFNPMAWSDLSIYYATLGQMKKAQSAMEVALSLGKNNRFILRSAARCFTHVGEPDRAITILNRSGLCHVDPWVASAEIAIADDKDLKSKCISKAKNLVQDNNLTQFSRGELAASIGTVEIKNGSIRRAKKLMRQAILDPTENALAQAEWMATQLGTNIADFDQLGNKVPASFEAQARHLYYRKQFKDSLAASEMWSRFQPLIPQPIIFSSFLASVCLDDDANALRILGSTLPTHRKDASIINNFAFSLARSGYVDRAIKEISKIDLRELSDPERLTLTATHGLIYFRTDKVEQGREFYSLAVAGFENIDNQHLAAIAAYFWAIEEKRIGSQYAILRIRDAKRRIKRFNIFELEDLAKKL